MIEKMKCCSRLTGMESKPEQKCLTAKDGAGKTKGCETIARF